MEDDMLTTQQAAEYLKISDRTMRNYIAQQRVKHIRMSDRIILFKKEWLDEFIEQSTILPTIKENEQ